MRHYVIVGILVIGMAFLTYAGINAAGLASHMDPVVGSQQAIPIDWLWNLEIMMICFLFALIVVPMFYSLVVFRRKKGDTGDGEHIEGNINLEIGWTVVPLIIVLVFAYMGAYSLGETRRVDPSAMVVKVTGMQWTWKFEYPDYGVVSDELHLPVNKQVDLQMTSTDVIHSFWVPEFRVKQDLVPGRTTELRITPILIANYKVRCAELCGTSHAYMEKPVVVTTKEDFDKWITEQQALAKQAASTPEGRGQKIYETYCVACHTINGSKSIAPTWFGLYGSQVELSDGSTVTADDAYILDSIKNPSSQVVNGFPPMSFEYKAAGLQDSDLNDILAFIKTLK